MTINFFLLFVTGIVSYLLLTEFVTDIRVQNFRIFWKAEISLEEKHSSTLTPLIVFVEFSLRERCGLQWVALRELWKIRGLR